MKLAKASLALLVIQLAIVSSIAARYLYQRWRCPRVWTRAAVFDPELPMRGRYLSLHLIADGCQSTLPSARHATFPRNTDGVPSGGGYSIDSQQWVSFSADLAVKDNKLIAIRIQNEDKRPTGQMVTAPAGASCTDMQLQDAVNFYLPEHAQAPIAAGPGGELWIEVTVPPKGPPRPLQLALKENGVWKPLAFN